MIFLIPSEVKNVLIQIESNGFEAYLVGGFVRDFILKRGTNDFDIATNALPKDLIKIFGPSKREVRYGSYHLKIESYTIDITTYRKEAFYDKGKPASIVYTSNMLLDAERRDFTMNAMYMNKKEEIIDLYDGIKDLKKKKIVMIGNPSVRLREDPIRILRAVRFATSYGFKLDKDLMNAIKKEKKHLSEVPLLKIKKELDAILLANGFNLLKQLHLLNELGILNKKIVYVEDLAGLWAQIKTTVDYPQEKTLKIRQKNIEKQLNCGTISMLNLYHFGFYETRIAAMILHFPIKRLEKMEKNLVIHSRKDIVLTPLEIAEVSHLKGKDLGLLIDEIEEMILLKKLPNEKEGIQKYIMER